jgi:hypothetical protein
MFDMARYVEFRHLLDRVEAAGTALMPNETETLATLKDKYAEPLTPDANDVTCLEVILRNIEIRKHYEVGAESHAGRSIDFKTTKRGRNG